MANFNDAKLQKMRDELGPGGTLNDLEPEYVKALSGLIDEPNRNDAWMAYWEQIGVPPGNFNDRALFWLNAIGFTSGSLQDRWYQYWTDLTMSAGLVEILGETLVVRLSGPASAIDLEAGVFITADGVPVPIVSSLLSPEQDHVVYFFAEGSIQWEQVVRVNYDSGVGTFISLTTGAAMRDSVVFCENRSFVSLYVNEALAGGFPPTAHVHVWNNTSSGMNDIGDGFFEFDSNFNEENGRSVLRYSLLGNNPTLEEDVLYHIALQCQNLSSWSYAPAVLFSSIVNVEIVDQVTNMGPFQTRSLHANFRILDENNWDMDMQFGSGTTGSSPTHLKYRYPRLTKLWDIP